MNWSIKVVIVVNYLITITKIKQYVGIKINIIMDIVLKVITWRYRGACTFSTINITTCSAKLPVPLYCASPNRIVLSIPRGNESVFRLVNLKSP